ncbi:LysM peptidoglycan-binding domain-containing protein [Salipiger bermudensis]|uniref:LysM peptidoglycan-binding domain-containing protein n=1 Tax=Salipiger bermudensis TaxID=344736 RepID=UPI001CD30E62|nr:LysM peptidoglycan-binding domain-containing protein [Salipiger bermudensis]MCA1284982.1 LysM peptidoglycan-binding domain-containing protein [Salipiger bermudensis]
MTKALGWGILGAVALAALLYLAGLIGPDTGPLSLVSPVETASVEGDTGSDAAVATNSATPEAPEAMPAPDAAEAGSEAPDVVAADSPAEAPAEPAPPRFDLVRADPGGQTLVAGSAAPGAEVSVLLDGEAQPVASADSSGRFALFLDLPPSADPRVLRLSMKLGEQEIASTEEVILAPPAPSDAPEPPLAGSTAEISAVAEAGVGPSAPGAEGTDAPGVEAVANDEALEMASGETAGGAVTPPAPADASAAAPAILLSTEAGVEVLQAPDPLPPGQVAIDAITYDETGGVTLSGRGSADATLRIYLDNRSVATGAVPETGRWRIDLPGVEGGTYTLRVDQLAESGDVSARAESPFLREEPAKLAAAADEAEAGEAALTAVTVQPGNTLWALARDRYGEGLAYVKVFEANREQIRNPDLIYPGQIFELPD